jgi:hypothetical protein
MTHDCTISQDELLKILRVDDPNRTGEHVGLSFFYDTKQKNILKRYVNSLYPDSMKHTIAEANKICDHNFSVFGLRKKFLGDHAIWHMDVKSGFVYPSLLSKDIQPLIGAVPGADIRIVWELNRFHHLSDLGKAYWYTGEEKYFKEFCKQVENWIQENPVGIGVNWTNPMEVAIRAVNWIFGYYFFRNSKAVDQEFWNEFTAMLFTHGRFILRGIEWNLLRDNHYIADLTGLLFLGLFFSQSGEGKIWLNIGYQGLLKEMKRQVLYDGVHYELSTAYHYLVTEMFALSALILQKNGILLPGWFWQKLENMMDFILAYTRPNGRASVIGDNDNGELCVLHGNSPNDYRSLLSIGAVLFKRSHFKSVSGEFQEGAFWILGPNGYLKYSDLNTLDTVSITYSRAFPFGGFYSMRHGVYYMIIRAGPASRGGPTGHAHCDALSFELTIDDTPFIIDPGTYVYTSDPAQRNLFRSTAYHNTIAIDQTEINLYDDKELFFLEDLSSCKANKWIVDKKCILFEGEHYGYQRLKNPVVHKRKILFLKDHPCWIINDFLIGRGEHQYDLYFHLDSGVSAYFVKERVIRVEGPNKWFLDLHATDKGSSLEIEKGWNSYIYGSKVKGQVIRISGTSLGNACLRTVLLPIERISSKNRM